MNLIEPNLFEKNYDAPFQFQNINPYDGFFGSGNYNNVPYFDAKPMSDRSGNILDTMVKNRKLLSEQAIYNASTGQQSFFLTSLSPYAPMNEEVYYWYPRYQNQQIITSLLGFAFLWFILMR